MAIDSTDVTIEPDGKKIQPMGDPFDWGQP